MINMSLIIVLVAVLLKVIFDAIKIKKEKYIYVMFIILFTLIIFREPISDLIGYFRYYDYLNGDITIKQFFSLNFEFMYKLLNVSVGIFSKKHYLFLVVVSIISLIGIMLSIKRYSKDPLIVILLYVTIGTYYMNFLILRQAIALSILIYSIKYIEEKKLIKFIIAIILAASFHKTSFVFLPIYFLCNIDYKKYICYIWPSIYLLTFLFKDLIMSFLRNKFYSSYNDYIYSGEGYLSLLMYIGMLIFSIILYKLYAEKKKNIKVKNKIKSSKNEIEKSILFKRLNIFFNFSFVTIFFQILATSQSIICRISSIFLLGFIYLVDNIIDAIDNEKTKKLIKGLVIISCIVFSIFYPAIGEYSFIKIN